MKNFKILTLGTVLAAGAIAVGGTFYGVPFGANANESHKEQKVLEIVDKKKADVVKTFEKFEKTSTGLENYKKNVKEINKKLKGKKATDIQTTITFSNPIALEELKQYVSKHNVKPSQFVARSTKGEEKITTVIRGDSLDKAEELIKKLEEEHNSTFLGFVDMAGSVNYNELDGLEDDAVSYLIDTSADEAATELQTAAYPVSLSWTLEELSVKTKVQGYNPK